MGRQAFAPHPEAIDAATVLGGAIRAARIDRGWTQARLANAISASVRTVSSIEAGAHTTSIGHVFSAAAVLGLPLFDSDTDGWARMARSTRLMEALLPRHIGNTRSKVPADRDF